MILLTGNSRYGTPDKGRAFKLSPGEWAKVTFRGFYKGYIRVGKRAYSCAFLKVVGGDLAPGDWVYCSKGAFMDIAHYAETKGFEPFYLEYIASKPYGTLNYFSEEDIQGRQNRHVMINQLLYGGQVAQA